MAKKAKQKTEQYIRKWDWNDPLEPITRETAKSNAALWDYALMGPGRSFAKLIEIYKYKKAYQTHTKTRPKESKAAGFKKEPPTKLISTLKVWSTQYDWQRRVARWDVINAEGLRETYLTRQLEAMEKGWQFGGDLLMKSAELLVIMGDFVEETVTEEEDPETGEMVKVIVKALKPSLSQIARAGKISLDILRLSANLPTERVELEGAALDAAIEEGLADLSELRHEAISKMKKSGGDGE